jgi:hypothetical protein
MGLKRTYRASDVNLLTACATIIESAITNVVAITANRPLWDLPFFNTLKTRIENAFPNFLGVDNAADMRAKTQIVNTVMDGAEKDLTTFSTQVNRDFRTDKVRLNEIRTLLGFTAHYKDAKGEDQESMIELLYKFGQNMTPALQTEIVNKGVNPVLITNITGYATTLNNANISQEAAKAMRGIISDAAVKEFNEIHGITVDVGVICQDIFKANSSLKKQFSFNHVVGLLDSPSVPVGP